MVLSGKPAKQTEAAMPDPQKLCELAAWYREFAEQTPRPAIRDARLRMAVELEREARRLECEEAALGLL